MFTSNISLKGLTNNLCIDNVTTNLAWTDIKKVTFGNQIREKEVSLSKICSNSHTTTLPLSWTFLSAIDACKVLGNGTVFNFEHPFNLTNIEFEYAFGSRFKEKGYYWTPYTDKDEEGEFRNYYTGSQLESIQWHVNQPNGGTDENYVLLDVYGKFWDTDSLGTGLTDLAVACSVPNKIVTLRGGCQNTLLGNHDAFNKCHKLLFEMSIFADREFYASMPDGILEYISFKSSVLR